MTLKKSLEFHKSKLFLVATIFLIFFFWILRVNYWSRNEELPFSDILDYINISYRIIQDFNFNHSDFWLAYKPPMVPLLNAIPLYLFGKENFLALKYFQSFFVFVSIIFLLTQIRIATKSKFVPLLLFFTITFSKPSIFWSLKHGTEAWSEMFVYLIIALTLYSIRKKNLKSYIALSTVISLGALCRPNFIILLPVLPFFPSIFFIKNKDFKKLFFIGLIYCLTSILVFVPWTYRNYVKCGEFVPISTQGPYSFIWELGDISFHDTSGKKITTNVQQLQRTASQNFENDCAASKYANKISKIWIYNNYKTLIKKMFKSTINQLINRDIYLTKLSRFDLNLSIKTFLFDKNKFFIIFCCISWLVLIFKFSWMKVLFSTFFFPTVFSSIFLSYPRMLEPFLSIIFFGGVFFLYNVMRYANSKFAKIYENNCPHNY